MNVDITIIFFTGIIKINRATTVPDSSLMILQNTQSKY